MRNRRRSGSGQIENRGALEQRRIKHINLSSSKPCVESRQSRKKEQKGQSKRSDDVAHESLKKYLFGLWL